MAAANVLVRRHYPAVLRFFELRSRAAEDLTQRTFLACLEARARFRRDASFRTFLFSIARKMLMKQMDEVAAARRLSSFDARPSPGTSLSALFVRRQEQQILLAALATLPEQTQTILVLHYWESLKSREIAAVIEVPTSTATTQLSRARRALAERVSAIASGRAGDAIVADLDRWTRSVASTDGLASIEPEVAAAVRRILTTER